MSKGEPFVMELWIIDNHAFNRVLSFIIIFITPTFICISLFKVFRIEHVYLINALS